MGGLPVGSEGNHEVMRGIRSGVSGIRGLGGVCRLEVRGTLGVWCLLVSEGPCCDPLCLSLQVHTGCGPDRAMGPG